MSDDIFIGKAVEGSYPEEGLKFAIKGIQDGDFRLIKGKIVVAMPQERYEIMCGQQPAVSTPSRRDTLRRMMDYLREELAKCEAPKVSLGVAMEDDRPDEYPELPVDPDCLGDMEAK